MLKKLKLRLQAYAWRWKNRLLRWKLSLLNNNFDIYLVELENCGYEYSRAVIFGFNKFYADVNHGSHGDIKVTNKLSQEYNGYSHLLAETQLHTQIKSVRMFSESKIMDWPVLYYKSHKAFGLYCDTPVPPINYLNAYQMQSNVVDIEREFVINGSNYFELMLKPQQKIQLCFIGNKNKDKRYKPTPIQVNL